MEVGKLTILFNDDAVNSAKDEHSRIKEILDNIIMVSGVVSNETKKSDKLINELVDTTNTVTNSMKEISAASQTRMFLMKTLSPQHIPNRQRPNLFHIKPHVRFNSAAFSFHDLKCRPSRSRNFLLCFACL